MTIDIKAARAVIEAATEAARGFNGTFAFDPEHTKDHGLGNVADFVEVDDRLVYVPDGSELRDDDCFTISDQIEQHVAEPMVIMLNAARPLASHLAAALDRIEELEGEVTRLMGIGYEAMTIELRTAERIAEWFESANDTECDQAAQDIRSGAWKESK